MPEILKNSVCYLVGAIDNASDQGIGWRQLVISTCKMNNLRIKFLDPTNKIGCLKKEVGEEHSYICNLKSSKRYDELSDFMHTIVRQDHRCVDLSDFIIFYIDPSVHTCGSYFELQSALTEKKPYFVITKGGKQNTPSWLFGIANHNFFFNSIEEVIDRLVCINNGTIELDDRWVLFRKELEEL